MEESGKQEPHDRHVHQWVIWYRENVVFFVRALKFYESLIHEDLSVLESDEDLRELLTEDVKKEFGLEKQKNQTIRTREWLESELEKAGEDSFDCDITMSHGSVRFIKSVSLLYIKNLYLRRNKLSTKPNISAKILKAVDTQI